MRTYLLTHRHESAECPVAYAAWKGFESPLRRRPTLSSCREGSHELWWRLEAEDEPAALASLPPWVAARTQVSPASEVRIP